MKRLLLLAVLGLSACSMSIAGVVLYAQGVPLTFHAAWDQNPPAENVVSYKATLDGNAPIVVLPATCTPGCTVALTVTALGSHTVNLQATNLDAFGTPQDSLPAVLTFVVKAAPGRVGNMRVTP